MTEFLYEKIDFIIIIILALLVAFIIGFNIIQVIDNKLNAVTINVPPAKCSLPPIYLNIDKNSNIKQIKLNDLISTTSTETQMSNQEDFGNIQDYPSQYPNNTIHSTASIINSNNTQNIINSDKQNKNQNYNAINDIPLLISPDTDVPNNANNDSKNYFVPKIKLIENNNSPLMKLYQENLNKINNIVEKQNNVPEINGTFDGYNAFADLKNDSYANITSIGKSMLTPYTSYPLPS